MKLPVVWLASAAAELRQATSWYGDIRPDLAARFALAVHATIATIANAPLHFAAAHRFPYSVVFLAEAERVVVLAVLPREA